jgi:2-amino-4-hydroxy-6-hydroxymethyldihydropteridine diphosphokinase
VVKTYLLLGSNLGNRAENLHYAVREISRLCGPIITTSAIYETAPWGEADQPWFFNQVIEIHTALPPEDLLKQLQHIETAAGRVRHKKWGPRILDIDILYYGEHPVLTGQLTVPPAALPHRRFALVPLAELAPNLVLPRFGCTVKELLEQCTDTLTVRKQG